MAGLTEAFPEPFTVLLRDHSPEELWSVRSHIHRELPQKWDTEVLLKVTRDYYEFMVQVRASATSADFVKLGRTVELGADALSILNKVFIDDDDTTFRHLIGMVLGAGVDLLRTSAYVQASLEGCEGLVGVHRARLYDHCWTLSKKMGTGERAGEGLDAFFDEAFDPALPLAQRVVMTFFLYRFLAVVNYWIAVKRKN